MNSTRVVRELQYEIDISFIYNY